jgi:hypothetical protein
MVTKQLSIAIAISICIGSGLAWPDLKTFAGAPTSETKIDFDQVFADAARHALLNLLNRWRAEAEKQGHQITRIAVAFEAGHDGFRCID